MLFPLENSTKENIIRVLSVSWPMSAIRVWHAMEKKNQKITYKAVFKALNELLKDKKLEKTQEGYKISEEWLKTTANTALEILYGYNAKYNQIQISANITGYKFSDEFYRILTIMLQSPGEIRLAAKTPALFIRNEGISSFLRQQYYNTLRKQIESNKKIYYLFSTEIAAKLIKEQKDKTAIEKLKELEKYNNLQIRHAPLSAVLALAITKNTALIGLGSSTNAGLVGFIKIDGPKLDEIEQLYDLIFANAYNINDFIQNIKNKKR